jgi:hypothetical protein
MSGITQKGLRRFNLLMAFVHGAQGVAVLILSANFKLPVTGSYLTFDNTSQSLMPASKQLFDLPLVWLIATFFFTSALSHLLAATLLNRRYQKWLKRGMNPLRWIEYAIGASVMMVAIAMLVGVYSIDALTMIFGLTAIMCLMGLLMERFNEGRDKITWLPYAIGTVAGLIPWVVVAHYLRLGAEQGSGPPAFVYFIFVSIFLTFSSFAFNMVLHYRQYKNWKDYLYTEKAYIWLSLVAKTALAWQVFAGTLRP